MTSDIYDTLSEIGERERQSRETLATLALAVATAAKARKISPDDANELYATYYAASRGVAAKRLDMTDATFKVNASKLRTIIRAADPDLLKRVAAIYEQANVTRPTLYGAMVDACRRKIAGASTSDNALRELLRK